MVLMEQYVNGKYEKQHRSEKDCESKQELHDPVGQQEPRRQMQQRFPVQDRCDGKQR